MNVDSMPWQGGWCELDSCTHKSVWPDPVAQRPLFPDRIQLDGGRQDDGARSDLHVIIKVDHIDIEQADASSRALLADHAW